MWSPAGASARAIAPAPTAAKAGSQSGHRCRSRTKVRALLLRRTANALQFSAMARRSGRSPIFAPTRMGPIGEGRIIDGCVTCPWHGYQYRLMDGCAPPPFTEKLVTYRVRIAHGVVEVDPRPLPPGTAAAMRYE